MLVKVKGNYMLELIAILTMAIDHIGKVFFPDIILLQIIGRLSFVIYSYFIAIGFSRTRNSKKYFLRVILTAIISQPFYVLLFGWLKLNICFTLSLGILFLNVYCDKKFNCVVKVIICVFITFISLFLGCDYGAYGIITIFVFYLSLNKKKYQMVILQSAVSIVCIIVFSYQELQYFSLLAFPIITFIHEQNQKFNSPKYINYLFYPAHLIIIALVKVIMA